MRSLEDRLTRCKAVLFDFDGTLFDTGALILESFRHTAREFLDEVPTDEVLMRNVGIPLRVQMEQLKPGMGAQMVAYYREHNHALHDEMARPFPYIEEVLADFKGRAVPMAVVTSKGDVAFRMGSSLMHLDRFIDVAVTADDVDVFKPDPYPLRVAAERLGVALTDTMYVGDSPHDMMAALRGGAIAVAVLWGGIFSEEALLATGPDVILEDPRDLSALIEIGRVGPL